MTLQFRSKITCKCQSMRLKKSNTTQLLTTADKLVKLSCLKLMASYLVLTQGIKMSPIVAKIVMLTLLTKLRWALRSRKRKRSQLACFIRGTTQNSCRWSRGSNKITLRVICLPLRKISTGYSSWLKMALWSLTLKSGQWTRKERIPLRKASNRTKKYSNIKLEWKTYRDKVLLPKDQSIIVQGRNRCLFSIKSKSINNKKK